MKLTSRRLSTAAAGAARPRGPLEGVKVLELGQFVAGPQCAMILACVVGWWRRRLGAAAGAADTH